MLRESGQAGAGLPRGRSGLASCSDTRHLLLLCWGEAGELMWRLVLGSRAGLQQYCQLCHSHILGLSPLIFDFI